ncbi:MAG TPA: hypothetical protein VKG62_05775 [Solirubrobacteraceae bacterium]|nr:hypothetical protein [Solirubrobacteraceae bacterium]
MSDDQDWRLVLDLDEPADLDGLVGRVRGGEEGFEHDARHALGEDVVLTHDGSRFFAYASSEASIEGARGAIENVLNNEDRSAVIRVSHWDDGLRAWRQTDPPLTAAEEEREAAAAEERIREAGAEAVKPETRTVVSVVGKLVRRSFEQQMIAHAESLGLEIEVVEHPHLLSTQVAFKVTGRTSAVEEFVGYVNVQAKAGTRMDLGLT